MGNAEGGRKTAAMMLARDPNHYRKLGAKGGKKVRPENRSFAKDPALASRAGKIGGKISRKK